jgi:4-hydroxyphenylpyruvate dioxygenase-like putative hemolysin
MVLVSRSKSSCTYMNAARTGDVSIATAKTTRAGAEAAVRSTAGRVKVKVVHLRRIGDGAIAYLTTTKARSVAKSLFAKNGNLVFLYTGSPKARHLMSKVIALAKAAASHTQ